MKSFKSGFQQRFKELKKDRGLSVAELSQKINYSKSIIFYWEKGEREPNAQALQVLADFFGVSIDYLVGREDDLGNVNVNGAELPPAEQEILSLFRSLGPFEREAILIQMRALAENKIKQ